jgi:molybdenum cofactor guanylyltransferase
VVGAVLAGGQSARMGRPKPLVELCGSPLICYPLEAIEAAGLEPLVVAKPDSELPRLSCRVAREPEHPSHPLVGIVAALRAAVRPAVVIACDMPFVPPAMLSWLAGLDERLAVCELKGRLHPLLGLYDPSLVRDLEAALARGESATDASRALDARLISAGELHRFGDPARICFNVNTPEDLEEARTLLATH